MKLAVLLLNLGGPSSLDEVEPFLFNLFSDPDTLPIPFFQKTIARVISKSRKKLSQSYYEAIGGGSPLKRITLEQANALEEKLKLHFLDVKVYVAMRYSNPTTEEAWKSIVQDQRTHLIILPLYPHYSIATTGSSLKKLKEVMEKNPYSIEIKTIYSWQDHPLYIDVCVNKIQEAIQKLPEKTPFDLIFSAHSLPMKLVKKGDPYPFHIKQTMDLILKKLTAGHPELSSGSHLAYQSKTRFLKWLEPSTLDILQKLSQRTEKRGFVIVPISFVSDHVETLYEIDIFYKKEAQKLGFPFFVRAKSLNTDPTFISALKDLVLKIQQSIGTIS